MIADDVTPEEVEAAKAIIRSIRRTVPAEDMLKRVRPVGSDRPFAAHPESTEEAR